MRKEDRMLQIMRDCCEGNLKTINDSYFRDIKWEDMIRKTSQNRVLFIFSKNLLEHRKTKELPLLQSNLTRIVLEGKKWLKRLRDTLLFLDSLLAEKGINFLTVKTYKIIPYVTYEVDILVQPSEYQKTLEVLRKAGRIDKHPGKQAEKQRNFFRHDLLTTDIHKGFSWQGFEYLDANMLWKGVRKQEIGGVPCIIPSLEVEMLLNMAHILFERRYVTLLDFLYIKSICQDKPDWATIVRQTEEYGWNRSFSYLALTINSINKKIYPDEEGTMESLDQWALLQSHLGKKTGYPEVHEMPHFLPFLEVMKIFQEKAHYKGSLPKWDIAYYFYTTLRYYLSGRRRMPYYLDWVPLGEFVWK